MCKISDKIKFCTCDLSGIEDLKNYWILHRYDSEKGYEIIGEIILPFFISPDILKHNKDILLKRLNEPGVFDIELSLKSKDRLQIHLCWGEEEYDYGFVFENKQWVECEYDFFDWSYNHVEAEHGTIEIPFETLDK